MAPYVQLVIGPAGCGKNIVLMTGQIELYSNHSAFRNIVESLHAWGWRLVACQSAMMSLELPHVNVLSKVDGFVDKSVLDLFLKPEHMFLAHNLQDPVCGRFSNLTRAVSGLLDDYSMVFFHTLDISDEQSLADLLYTVNYVSSIDSFEGITLCNSENQPMSGLHGMSKASLMWQGFKGCDSESACFNHAHLSSPCL
eukprot:31397-Pelagococcus_subviridis.AAC.2